MADLAMTTADLEAWCIEHGVPWDRLTAAQRRRAEDIARAPMTYVPLGLHGGLIRWIIKGIPPGSFLLAVLTNDLREACGRADDFNRTRLFDLVRFLYNHAPRGCWGSQHAVEAWTKSASAFIPEEEVPY
ncbi:hypothetical protein [Sandarakinorhabdus sp.]|uniref:hypothetical protein n=1 Tax=Sandarakinorhabdus sp. TaxID=1916663 RepID=UPI00286DDB6F|nr:hypothetical protein [Sandarakinorhabdus sp.]